MSVVCRLQWAEGNKDINYPVEALTVKCRLLKTWLEQPLQDVAEIRERLDVVAYFSSPQCQELLTELRKSLAKICNLHVGESCHLDA